MEVPISPNSAEAIPTNAPAQASTVTQANSYAQAISRQRAELEAFLAAQREQLAGAEARMAERLQGIARELAETQSAIQRTQEEQAARAEQLAREAKEMARLQQSVEASQAEWRESREQAATEQRQLARQIQDSQEALAHRFDELTSREAQLTQSEARLRRSEEELALAEVKTRQRDAELTRSREALDARLQELESRLGEATRHEDLIESELAASRQTCANLEEKLAVPSTAPRGDDSRKELQSERDALAQRLDEAQNRLAELQRQLDESHAGTPSEERSDEDADRYEEAMENIRRLKAQNDRLEKQLADAKGSRTAASLFPNVVADWESQKQRLLAALEDLDEDDEEYVAQRIEMERVIQTTDVALAAKDQEINELKRLVQQQQGQVGAAAAALTESAKVLDQDALILQEREKLRHLQDELQAKLRQAEIEISIERADMARQRMEIEEIMRQFAEDSAAAAAARPGAAPDKVPGRRWLNRLGIKKSDEGGA